MKGIYVYGSVQPLQDGQQQQPKELTVESIYQLVY
jgi:hypothetical protein